MTDRAETLISVAAGLVAVLVLLFGLPALMQLAVR